MRYIPNNCVKSTFQKVSRIFKKTCHCIERRHRQIINDWILKLFGVVCLHRGKLTVEHQIQHGVKVSHRHGVDLSIYFSLKSTTRKTAVYGRSYFSLASCLALNQDIVNSSLASPFIWQPGLHHHLCVSFGQSAGLGAKGTKAKVKHVWRSGDVFTDCVLSTS